MADSSGSTIFTEYNPLDRDDINSTANNSGDEMLLESSTHSNFILMNGYVRIAENSPNRPSNSGVRQKVNLLQFDDDDIDMQFLIKDLWWSITSNLFFILGSTVYILSSSWDYISFLFAHSTLAYHIFEWAGPTVYLINSAIDIGWATFLQSKNRNQRQHQPRDHHQLGSPSSNKTPILSLMMMNWNKIRKHAAHRRGLLAAVSFGLAAFFGLVDLAYYYYGNYESTLIAGSDRGIMDALSIHMYLVSAIFAVTGRRTRPRAWTFTLRHPDNLEDLGDLFFLIGSLVDVVLCDSHFHNNAAFWPIFASLLWFFDACFYLRSDMLTKSVYDEVTLLYTNGQLRPSSSSLSSHETSGTTKSLILNRIAKMSGDKEADKRLASNICKANKSLV
jgi:hypothetical protein